MWQGFFFFYKLLTITFQSWGDNSFVWYFTNSYLLKHYHTEKRMAFTHVLVLKRTSVQKPIQLSPEGESLVYLQQGHRFISIRNDGILRHTIL